MDRRSLSIISNDTSIGTYFLVGHKQGEIVEKLILTFVMGIVLIFVTTMSTFSYRDYKDCEKKGGVYSAHTCFKREVIQE